MKMGMMSKEILEGTSSTLFGTNAYHLKYKSIFQTLSDFEKKNES